MVNSGHEPFPGGLTPEQWRTIDTLFERLLDAPPARRPALIDELSGSDGTIRRALLALVDAAGRPEPSLQPGGMALEPHPFTDIGRDALATGDLVGSWRIVREIGRGGVGTVYLAERGDGQYAQRAALKVLRRGLDTDDVLEPAVEPETPPEPRPKAPPIESRFLFVDVAAMRAKILEKLLAPKAITTVLTFGDLAHQAFEPFAAAFEGTWLKLEDPRGDVALVVPSWNTALTTLSAATGATVVRYTTRGFANKRTMIPREDLAWGAPLWFGSSGDLSQHPHESWIFRNAPRWVNTDKPTQTTAPAQP